MNKREEIKKRVFLLLEDFFFTDAVVPAWLQETSGSKDLDFDSLDEIEFVMAIEDEFSVEITDDEAEKLLTVGHVIDFLTEKFASTDLPEASYAFADYLNPTPTPTPVPQGTANMSLATINLSSFKYRKDSGDLSSRSVVVVDEDDERVLGLEVKGGDLTEIQPYLAYEAELAEIREHLRAKYGIDEKKLPYKSFKQRGISSRTDVSLQINL